MRVLIKCVFCLSFFRGKKNPASEPKFLERSKLLKASERNHRMVLSHSIRLVAWLARRSLSLNLLEDSAKSVRLISYQFICQHGSYSQIFWGRDVRNILGNWTGKVFLPVKLLFLVVYYIDKKEKKKNSWNKSVLKKEGMKKSRWQ